ncbi:hypothetical protein PIROE2DRAFT_10344, partial [Piromyces sp. E2]
MFYGQYEDQYYISPLPGEKEGISASCIGGSNIIINKSISKEKKIAAGKIINFLLSKDIQKKYIIDHGKPSAMNDIYYDEELCSKINCTLFRNLQYVTRSTNFLSNYDEYSSKFRAYIYDFLYGNVTAKDTLQKIEDIAYINFIEYSSNIGITVIVISIVTTSTLINYISVIWIKMYYEKNKTNNINGVKIVKNEKQNSQNISFSNQINKKSNVLSKLINYHYTDTSSSISNDSSYNSNITNTPEIKLYTSIIQSSQLTDISDNFFLNTTFGLTINLLTFFFDVENHYQEDIVNDFNKYAIEQDLDIEIHRTALSILNTTVFVDDYASFVETVLNKNSNDYDLFL